MSNVAAPVPKLLKNREANVRKHLAWAISYIRAMTDDLHDCNVDPDGTIQGRDIYVEITRCRKWLKQAEKIV